MSTDRRTSPVPPPVFYLKINRNTDAALRCFRHWVAICNASSADFYVICDNSELRARIDEATDSQYKFIPSYRERAGGLLSKLNIEGEKWTRCGAALLTPFYHAKDNGTARFWNIDADDLMLTCDAETLANALARASEYADANGTDLFQMDLHYTCFNRRRKLGSFGVSYSNDRADCLEILRQNIHNIVPIKGTIGPWNIDTVFSVMQTHLHLLNVAPFYAENLFLWHIPCCTGWHNGRLHFKNRYIWKFWGISRAEESTGVSIPQECVKIDAGISDVSCLNWLGGGDGNPALLREIEDFQTELERRRDARIKFSDDIVQCETFEPYVFALFNFAQDLIIFISSSDAHVPPSLDLRKLRLLNAFGVETDLRKTFRHSWFAVIDGGNVVQEHTSENLMIASKYNWDNHRAEIMSQGWNYSRSTNVECSIKIDGTEYAVSKRGLNFVIWDKTGEKVIDSVCFDTWDNVSFSRKKLNV
jgi:hypothetical protein